MNVPLREKRGVTSNILSNCPGDSRIRRLGGDGAEDFSSAEPQATDAIILVAAAGFEAKLESEVEPRRRAAREWRVRGGVGRTVDGFGEGVVNNVENA